ncbi:MAG: PorV/PorQ family protein [Candidatus Poribacteria bacterium]|nr:PorV/PorQ family protein [Candidatus Poribacteria bacterium]
MMLKRGAVLIVMALLIIIAPAPSTHAVDIHDGAGTTGAAFLKIEGGSRPAGLGGAFAGLANDINTIFWNPAGLTAVHDRELTAMQHFSFADINNQTIGYAQRIERLVWGASFLGSFTEIERRQGPTEDPDSTVTVGGFATGLSLAYPLGEAISIGGTAKIISEQLDIQNAFGVAADVGLVARLLDNRLGIGVAVQNAGVLDGGENLPIALRAGLAYRTWKQPAAEAETDKPMPTQELWALVADAHLPLLDANPSFHVGVERWFYESIAARIGYRIGFNENPSDGLSLGVGVRRSGEDMLANIDFQFDYAFIPDAYVGNAHRVSFITRF